MAKDENYVEILDIIHVIEYAWQAADILCEQQKGRQFIAFFLLRKILHGRVADAISSIEVLESERNIKDNCSERLEAVKRYFRNNASRMKYDEYLENGYPIASGVIEGACRHVVKDRMELSGMRWNIATARNILTLRCIVINDHWQDYIQFHIHQENNRLYQPLADNDNQQALRMVA